MMHNITSPLLFFNEEHISYNKILCLAKIESKFNEKQRRENDVVQLHSNDNVLYVCTCVYLSEYT